MTRSISGRSHARSPLRANSLAEIIWMTCERDFPCGGVLETREARVPGAVSHARTQVVARAGPSRVRCLSPPRCVSPRRLRSARIARRWRVHHHPSFGAIHPAHRAIHRFFHPPSSRAGCRCEGRAAQWTELAQARGDRHGRVARAAPLQDGRALRAVHPPEDQRGTSSPRETYSLRSLRVPSRACAETSWNTILAARRKCAVRSLRHTSLDANDRRSQRTIDRLSRPARVDLLFSSVGLTD